MNQPSMFKTADGKSYGLTFALVSSLFLLWGLCNGMIDTMDKHFQDQLHLTKAQSAWVQFAHYMGYALMALPAGLLTRRIGYKGGIIFGLLLVAMGGFWFMPATHISQFWAFLMGVCLIAMGLTILETVANPYTTVLGPPQFGASRINLAQSFNGIGWIVGPLIGSAYFYSEGGVEVAHGQLYVPYVGVGIVVLMIAVMFFFAPVPDIKVADEYHTDDDAPGTPVAKERNRPLILLMMFLNVAAVGLSIYLILNTIVPSISSGDTTVWLQKWLPYLIVGVVLLTLPSLRSIAKRVTSHSIWAHPHFSAATLTQFAYVAAQAGIFSFFINSMTVDKNNGYSMVPALPASWSDSFLARWSWIEARTAFQPSDIKSVAALADKLQHKPDAVSAFLAGQLSANTSKLLSECSGAAAVSKPLHDGLVQDLNNIIRQELGKDSNKPALFEAQRFDGIGLNEKTQQLVAAKPTADHPRLRLNRLLLQDAMPDILPYDEATMGISDKGAGQLSSIAFVFFLLGRLTGAALLKKSSAHKVLGTYGAISMVVCALIIAKLGWISVLCVFLSYFFMSIMFPTIFALGIFGLGAQSKKKASAFIVMSITGGALMPKFMGHLGDVYNMSAAFWMPLGCFIFIALYGFCWSKLSGSDGVISTAATKGH
jgi:fucose permease